ncbi:LOW QUALITY PROTEIN: neutral alpha-glucosidase AB-like [Uloborus diversus]|uniref:LOW QUALITY PROTEIN: neutral alpha-glucosidase AB-like n=2 Tax=Uloborus diversus TaxID=327109 RepID=UPI00240A88DE|nr:LOW QUALITY PROTEIN: neutral alpha-glucosidase AB-like [Uloborus diversus]
MATYKWYIWIIQLFIILNIQALVNCVDRGNFKTCDQSGFCKRHRSITPGHSPYYLEMSSFKIYETSLEGIIVNSQNGIQLKFDLIVLKDNSMRFKIKELNTIRHRFEAREALVDRIEESKLEVISQDSEKIILTFGSNKVILNGSPFRIDIFSGDQLVISANARGLMKFEHYRPKSNPKPTEEGEEQNEIQQQQPPVPPEEEQFKDTLWEETFKGHTDSKPYGPSSVGMDFSFVGFKHVYGIPEHADVFPLRTTKGTSDPYRLYNLDVFEYDLNNPMAIYGSIPFMVAHSETQTVGLLWLNAAETWVDVEASSNQGVVSSIVDFVKGNTQIPQQDSHWISESGIIDVFFLLGPGPKDVMFQYAKLTGVTPLPPLFSLGYHQCRWNYRDQDDVRNVDAGFDENDIPYDVLWLDLDHTHDRKYFTWDPYKFPDPIAMQTNLTAKGRKMVTLVDPHIKRDNNYYIHKEATDRGFYVKNKENQDYEGWCWPGASGYLDFLSPEVRDWWSSKYALDQYQGSTLSLYTWNDMNEPSVFSEPEVTMPKDCKHVGGWEHRDIHNMYGFLMVMATYKGHLMRSGGAQRPFILSRSVFAGSQRYGAVWTGDNIADWNHLQISVPMILSLSIAGMSFSGADVGGFFRNPTPELMLRWYQAGAYQPFFRAHSHHETKRREPWLFEGEYRTAIRDAIRARYPLLPLWYTLFYENERTGVPPMRPVWMEFPTETITFDMNDEYIIGSCLLVRPVLEESVVNVNVYFPGTNEVWYDIITHEKYDGGQSVSVSAPLSKIPVYQRGGTIIPKKGRIRRSSSLTYNDPYTLVIALDKSGTHANGTLYIDDFNSFKYREGNFLLLKFSFEKNIISSKILEGKFKTSAWLEKIIIVGLEKAPKSIILFNKNSKTELISKYDENQHLLTIRKPGVNIGEEWKITL